MPDEYCELHAHSNFSFLDGASHPEELIGRAAVLGMPSLAITDHAGLYAAVRLWKAAAQTRTAAARDAGLSPVSAIVGLELAIPADERSLRLARRGRKLNDPLRGEKASRGWPGEFHAGPMPGDHLVLLARDGTGYAALSRLASRGHLAGEKQFPVFERALVEAALDEARGHLVGLSGCRSGEVPRQLLAGDPEAALAAAQAWASHFPDGDFAVELSHHLQPDDDWLVAQLAELAERAGLPTVVTNEVHYADPGGHRLQDVLVCIRHGATLDDARELLLPNAEYRLKSGAELARIGPGLPDERSQSAWADGLARAAGIGRSCRLDLDFERYRFPGFTVPEGETPFSYLYQLAHEGLRRRYRPITKQAVKQLAHELDVIERTNLAEFFLIVWDLMEFARQRGIIGQGRGSAGDSIVAYCLGITKVDPIEHKLLFERFINEARTLPDIDIDFDVNRREEVIQYLYDRYGEDHSAMVCTVITYRARSAVREVAKALGFPLDAVDRVAKALDTRDASDVARDLALDGSFGWLFDEIGARYGGGGSPVEPRRTQGRWWRARRPRIRFLVEPPSPPGIGTRSAATPRRPGRCRGARPGRIGRSRRAAVQRVWLGAAATPTGARPVGRIGQARGVGAEALRARWPAPRPGDGGAGCWGAGGPGAARQRHARRLRRSPCRGARGPGVRHAHRGAPPPERPAGREGRGISPNHNQAELSRANDR